MLTFWIVIRKLWMFLGIRCFFYLAIPCKKAISLPVTPSAISLSGKVIILLVVKLKWLVLHCLFRCYRYLSLNRTDADFPIGHLYRIGNIYMYLCIRARIY